MSIPTGTYYPNRPGAKTWCEARSMYIGAERVSAQVMNDGTCVVYVGLRWAYNGPVPENITTPGQFHEWAITVAETFAAAPVESEPEPVADKYAGMSETEITNIKGARYLAAFEDSNYGEPFDDREYELISSIEHAKRELWTRAVRNQGRTRYIDTALDADTFSFFPCVTDNAQIMLYAFDVIDGELVRYESPTHRVFMGPRGGIKVERL